MRANRVWGKDAGLGTLRGGMRPLPDDKGKPKRAEVIRLCPLDLRGLCSGVTVWE